MVLELKILAKFIYYNDKIINNSLTYNDDDRFMEFTNQSWVYFVDGKKVMNE